MTEEIPLDATDAGLEVLDAARAAERRPGRFGVRVAREVQEVEAPEEFHPRDWFVAPALQVVQPRANVVIRNLGDAVLQDAPPAEPDPNPHRDAFARFYAQLAGDPVPPARPR